MRSIGRRLLTGILAALCLAVAAWTVWRGEATFVVMLIAAAALIGATFGPGLIEAVPKPPAANDNRPEGRWWTGRRGRGVEP